MSEPSIYCATCDTHLRPHAMKYFTAHNLLPLEASPTAFPESSSRGSICSSHLRVTQPLRLPTEKYLFYTHQHSCSCNVVPFLAPWDFAGTSASSSLCENSSALHFLTSREMAGLSLHSHSTAPIRQLAPTCA